MRFVNLFGNNVKLKYPLIPKIIKDVRFFNSFGNDKLEQLHIYKVVKNIRLFNSFYNIVKLLYLFISKEVKDVLLHD